MVRGQFCVKRGKNVEDSNQLGLIKRTNSIGAAFRAGLSPMKSPAGIAKGSGGLLSQRQPQSLVQNPVGFTMNSVRKEEAMAAFRAFLERGKKIKTLKVEAVFE